jgi:hypothetical protein
VARTSRLPDLIEDIYDAALEPARWNDVVVGINDFIGSQACGLISRIPGAGSGRRIITVAPIRITSASMPNPIPGSIR